MKTVEIKEKVWNELVRRKIGTPNTMKAIILTIKQFEQKEQEYEQKIKELENEITKARLEGIEDGSLGLVTKNDIEVKSEVPSKEIKELKKEIERLNLDRNNWIDRGMAKVNQLKSQLQEQIKNNQKDFITYLNDLANGKRYDGTPTELVKAVNNLIDSKLQEQRNKVFEEIEKHGKFTKIQATQSKNWISVFQLSMYPKDWNKLKKSLLENEKE